MGRIVTRTSSRGHLYSVFEFDHRIREERERKLKIFGVVSAAIQFGMPDGWQEHLGAKLPGVDEEEIERVMNMTLREVAELTKEN